MRPTTQKAIALAATLLALAVFMTTATAANAASYCIKDGAQAAHGCGYPNLERCKAASSGIGGICSRAPADQSSDSALSHQARQQLSRSS